MIIFSDHATAASCFEACGPAPAGPDRADPAALRDLERLGFLRAAVRSTSGRGVAPSYTWRGADGPADRRLLQLLARFDLQLQLGMAPDEASWIALTVWQPAGTHAAEGGGVFSGTGFHPDDAVRSCLGEFAEFQSWLYRPGDETRHCRGDELAAGVLDPWQVLGFAADQRGADAARQDLDPVPEPSAFAGEIDWTRIRDLEDGAERWLPTQLCYGRHASRSPRAKSAWRSDSNGCAAGADPARAEMAALLELIERDATGIWWHGQCRRPALDPASAEDQRLLSAIAVRARAGQRVILLDLTHDIGVPVVAAILLDAGDALSALGFGCHPDPCCAMSSAYLEMCQMELSVALVRQRAARAKSGAAADDRRLLRWLSAADSRHLPQLAPAATATSAGRTGRPGRSAIDGLRAAGLRAYAIDLQRPDIGIAAKRVFVPGLCHFKPRLGHRRLIEVPRRLGWRDGGFDAAQLSRIPLML